MSWTPVDFSLVRYSPIENTHFFYDERHPSSVQFLLSGRWESWDVSYVGYKSRDPDIRRIAREAGERLIHDPQSGYRQWPSEPPPSAPVAPSNGQPAPPTSEDDLFVHEIEAATNQQQTPLVDLLDDLVPLSPSPEPTPSAQLPAPLTSQDGRPPVLPAPEAHYASPYGQPPPNAFSHQTPVGSFTAVQATGATNSNTKGAVPPQQAYPAQGPPLQPSVPSTVVLSRTRDTKILLSIDGDGVRGLSALLLIESLVNAICVKIGQRLDPHQIFDLTGGSSLGGVIAILLCRLQMQAHRAREAYKKISRQVYLNKRDFYVSLDPHAPLPNGDGAALEEEITQVIRQELGTQDERLFDGREDSGSVFVISTHIEIGTNKAALMRSYQTRRITGPDLDANMTIAQAMKATSVAPRYMAPQPGVNHRLVIQPGLVDHGTAKNNPVRDILYECRKLFRYANDMMIIISIGTGIGLNRDNEIAEMVNGVEDRNAEARTWGEKFEMDHQPLMERGWMKYYRFNVPGLEDVPLEEWCHEDIIKKKTSEYLAQPEIAHMFYACVDAITKLLLGPQG